MSHRSDYIRARDQYFLTALEVALVKKAKTWHQSPPDAPSKALADKILADPQTLTHHLAIGVATDANVQAVNEDRAVSDAIMDTAIAAVLPLYVGVL